MNVPRSARILQNRTLIAVSVSVAAGYTGIGMVVPVRVLYAQSRGASLAVIGAMASSYLISNFAFQYPGGALADRWGRKPLLAFGFLAQAILTISYLLVADPLLFVALRFLEGIAGAAVLPPARALIADTVPEDRRGEAYGLFGSFFNAGFLLGPAAGGLLGGLGYGAAFIGSIVFRAIAILLVVTLIHEPRQHAAARRAAANIPYRALFTPALLASYALSFGDYLWLGFDLTVGTLWLRYHLNASLVLIGLTYAAWSVPSMVISPFAGRLADHTRRWRVILIFGLAQVPLYVGYALVRTIPVVMVLMVVQSICYSFVAPASDSWLAAASPSQARARAQSVATGIGLISAFLASSVLPVIYGIDYRWAFYVLDAVFTICLISGGVLVQRAESRTRSATAIQVAD